MAVQFSFFFTALVANRTGPLLFGRLARCSGDLSAWRVIHVMQVAAPWAAVKTTGRVGRLFFVLTSLRLSLFFNLICLQY